MAEKLTTRKLDTLRSTQRVEIFDALVMGLGVRVTPRGVRTWFVRYRLNGAQRRMKLGRYPTLSLADARDRARKLLTKVEDGEDPALEHRTHRSQDTRFAALAAEVLTARAPFTCENTQNQRRRTLEHDLLPEWGDRPAASITRRDVVQLVERIAARAPVLAEQVLSLTNTIYNEGLRRSFPTLEANPAHLLRPPVPVAYRERFLTVDEIGTVWRALEREAFVSRLLCRFLLLTAQRVTATCELRWGDLEGGVWRTPANVFKGKRDHLVPLSSEAIALLDELRPWTGGGEHVFPGKNGTSRRSADGAMTRLRERTDLARWTWHDTRRTFRTHTTRAVEDGGLGIAAHVADAVLGHSEKSLGFTRYTGDRERYLLAEKRDALAKWGAFVRSIIETR